MDMHVTNTFPRKEYGRIFVEKESDIEIVKEIIKQIDAVEYECIPCYDFIAVFETKEHIFNDGTKHYSIDLKYTDKYFDIDLNKLQSICWMNGVHVFCVMSDKEEIFIC